MGEINKIIETKYNLKYFLEIGLIEPINNNDDDDDEKEKKHKIQWNKIDDLYVNQLVYKYNIGNINKYDSLENIRINNKNKDKYSMFKIRIVSINDLNYKQIS